MNNLVKHFNSTTCDSLFCGRLILQQPRQGYRFSADSPLLIWFACQSQPTKRCADLGAGCGVIGLGLLAAAQVHEVVAVEVQPNLVTLCEANAASNEMSAAYRIFKSDIREFSRSWPRQSFDLIVANPPFWNARNGRLPKNEERRIACHEVLGTLDDWIAAAARLLNQQGRLCLVFPAQRLDVLIVALHQVKLRKLRLCPVYPGPGATAELVLVEAKIGRAERLTIEPPLVLKDSFGADTAQAAAIYSGQFSSAIAALPDRRGPMR